jgi:hypothetical protein
MPYWAPTLVKNAVIGVHIFYRWPGGWGQPSAFTQKWVRRESDPKLLRTAALAAEARHDAAELAAKDETPEAIVDAATDVLPPELAKLVEAEAGPEGKTRVSMTIAGPGKDEATGPDTGPASTSLEWGLTGRAPDAAEEAPLGRKEIEPPTAPASATE